MSLKACHQSTVVRQPGLRHSKLPVHIRRPHGCLARAAPMSTGCSSLFVGDSAAEAFAQNVSGEWEGVIATFSAAGERQPLPEYYVPAAYREWGVELYDWQSQCSSTTTADGELRVTTRRLMPTVGCEADAIAFTEDTTSSSSSTTQVLAAADGSYSLSPAALQDSDSKVQLESCFVVAPLQQRVRIVQQLQRDWSKQRWQLHSVELHREKYEGPYTGKRELAGCGGGQAAISDLPSLQQQQLEGSWQPVEASCSSYSWKAGSYAAAPWGTRTWSDDPGSSSSSQADSVGQADKQQSLLTCLPLGAYSWVSISGDNITAEAGVLAGSQQQQQEQQASAGSAAAAAAGADAGRTTLHVATRKFKGGRLVALSLGAEVVG